MLRIPPDFPDFAAVEHEADVLESRARLLGCDPIARDPQAGDALDEQTLIEAGEQSDADDQAALRLVVNE
jgi:hypothetical protein